jgi:hypothetical protein
MKRLRWLLSQGIATFGGAAMCAGCGYTVTASDGTLFRQSERMPDALSAALATSAAHDLPCSSADLGITRLETETKYLVTGCGSQVLYRVLTPSVASGRIELVSRSAPTAEHPTVSRTTREPASRSGSPAGG